MLVIAAKRNTHISSEKAAKIAPKPPVEENPKAKAELANKAVRGRKKNI